MLIVRGKEYYTISEIAEKFDVTPATVSSWIRTDVICAKKVGRQCIIPVEEVEKLLNPFTAD